MKRLLLIRHAKSSWEYSIADHLRPLNKRGLRDQERMALFLQDSDEKLDAIYSSCAVRAMSLAEGIGKKLCVNVVSNSDLYTFNTDHLAAAIRSTPDTTQSVAVVTHNPAVTTLSNQWSGAGISNMPTSGIVAIRCACDSWASVCGELCKLDYFVAPKLLE